MSAQVGRHLGLTGGRWSVAILALTVCAGAVGTPVLRAQQVEVNSANRTIAVTASDEAKRKADTASINIGYRIYAADSQGAYAQAAKLSNAIVAALKSAGVADDAIESTGQSTSPVQDFVNQNIPDAERAQRKFEATQSWTVKSPAAEAAKLLGAAVVAGANESGVAQWGVADEDSLTAEAASKALVRAKAVAAQMASGLGAQVGELLFASNQAESRVMPMMARAMGKGVGGAAGGGVLHPELSMSAPMITRSATVSAIFAIK